MKALVGAFNQEKALVGSFSVIVQPVVEPMDRFTALLGRHKYGDWGLVTSSHERDKFHARTRARLQPAQ